MRELPARGDAPGDLPPRGEAVRDLPVRGHAVRDLELPLPGRRMPVVRGGRPLKRWRYVGVFGAELCLCAAEAWIGPLGQRFWGLATPDGRLLSGRSLLGTGGVEVGESGVGVRARAREGGAPVEVAIELAVAGTPPAVESVSASGVGGYVWTRKRAGVAARGTVEVRGRRRAIGAEAVIDETAGYHRRHTLWRWSAGVGRTSAGGRVAWNLVEGVNDDPIASERTVWLDGEPFEPGPVTFSADLTAVRSADGTELSFGPWATLAHRTRLGVVRSDYRQPFGAFAGTLPGGIELAEGHGVMELHEARW
jgi:hypothetical protein